MTVRYGRVRRLYADGRELRSSVKVELGRGELVVDRVYDLAPPE